jgi:hypothetical protein
MVTWRKMNKGSLSGVWQPISLVDRKEDAFLGLGFERQMQTTKDAASDCNGDRSIFYLRK